MKESDVLLGLVEILELPRERFTGKRAPSPETVALAELKKVVEWFLKRERVREPYLRGASFFINDREWEELCKIAGVI